VIFRIDDIRRIRQGIKTQDRRPITGEKECAWKLNRAYKAQASHRAATLEITMIGIERSTLEAMTLRDAKREGFRTSDEYRAHWSELHGKWNPKTRVWVLSFVAGDHTDRPRLLAARPGPPHGDYVTEPARALTGSAEEVDKGTQAVYSQRGLEGLQMAHSGVLSSQCDRLRAAIAGIREFAPNPSVVDGQLRGLERQLASLERRLAA
jgi:hypothetical protein